MNQYRIYLSVRLAETGAQVADITILEFIVSAQDAEGYVERFNNGKYAPAFQEIERIKTDLAKFWPGVRLLFVFMKELAASGTVVTLLANACRAVDKDIEQAGVVTAETVELVRAAVALA